MNQSNFTLSRPITMSLQNTLNYKAKIELFNILVKISKEHFNVDISSQCKLICDKFEEPAVGLTEDPTEVGQNISIPMFALAKSLLKGVKDIKAESTDLAVKLDPLINAEFKDSLIFEKAECIKGKPYVIIFMKSTYLGQLLFSIKDGSYTSILPDQEEKVMIEYSQPNTHKVFHVGHMRNASLGMSLVKIFEFNKFKVNAVNYIGDIGTHIAKCLWFYLNYENQSKPISENVPKGMTKVEYLGDMYAKGNDMLDFSKWTRFVFPGVVTAQIIEIADYPSNPKLKVLQVTDGKDKF
jgi:arginyl-tRNA synthetase